MLASLEAALAVVTGLVSYCALSGHRRTGESYPGAGGHVTRYKTSLCRDLAQHGRCPRGNNGTFAHSQAELELHLATTVQTASQNTAYSSSGTSRRDGKDGHLHCMDAHGLRASAAFDVPALHGSSSNLLRSNPHTPRGPTLSELASVSGRGV